MIENIFDTHSHYDDKAFDEDRYELINALPEQGVVGIINCGTDIKSSSDSLKLSEQFDFVYAACGIHPHECDKHELNTTLDDLKKLLIIKKCVAVGEIGLDYHYDFSPREKQIEFFEAQIRLAKEMDLPVIVHNRQAHEDTLKILKKYQPKGVLHCFSGSVEMAKEVIKIGLYIGIGGSVTFKNAKKPVAVAKYVPDDKLLVETDCPYMAPVPLRGKRCTSDMIMHTAQVIAQIRDTQTQEVLNSTHKNALTLFNISSY
ncbi:MAG TPA: TatD family hydrolase [Clostridia bacterium]|nr:TatD family hydrolase [Clostridia bacterium]